MSDIEELKNFREVGYFDLLNPPLTPVGTIDAQRLDAVLRVLVEEGRIRVILDLSGLDFLYSDTLSVISKCLDLYKQYKGHLGVLTSEGNILASIKQARLDQDLLIFAQEPEIITFSLDEEEQIVSNEATEDKAVEAKITAEKLKNQIIEEKKAHALELSQKEKKKDIEAVKETVEKVVENKEAKKETDSVARAAAIRNRKAKKASKKATPLWVKIALAVILVITVVLCALIAIDPKLLNTFL